MKNHKREFINNEILTSSIIAGLGRGYSVYDGKNDTEKNRIKLKNFLREKLLQYSEKYKKSTTSDEHLNNIKKFADEITKKHKEILQDGCFRIGRAQKLLNLYLKFQWVLGWIPEPPHCPFDYKIITKELDSNISWTKMDKIADYKLLVEKAESKAKKQHLSIAEWELQAWNSIN